MMTHALRIAAAARAAGLTALLVVLAFAPLGAQDYNRSAAIYAGLISFGDFNVNSANLVDGGRPTSLSLGSGWVVGLQADSWFDFRNLGWRLNGAFTQRPLNTIVASRNIGVSMADLSLLLRLLPVRPTNPVQIYLAGGGGIVYYDFGEGERVIFPGHNAIFLGRSETLGALVFGAGIDIGFPIRNQPYGVRVEFMDNMLFDSPFVPITGDDFGSVHNRRISLGVFSGFDFLR
jgi:hypothetical protein